MRSLPRTTAVVVGAVLAGGAVTGCAGSPEKPSAPAPTAVAQIDPGATDLVRVEFCDLVPTKAVTAALGGPSATAADWGNGESPPLEDSQTDLAHEFGCSWTGADQTTARAWVFARPVTAEFGRQVIDDGRDRNGCSTQDADFGDPGALQTCTVAGGRTRVRYAGLFGATWLTCEIAGTGGTAAVQPRTEQWCLAVANALDTER